METITLKTKYGTLECAVGYDAIGNPRVWPVEGVSLEEWRNDNSKIPPYILYDELEESECKKIAEFPHKIKESLLGSIVSS